MMLREDDAVGAVQGQQKLHIGAVLCMCHMVCLPLYFPRLLFIRNSEKECSLAQKRSCAQPASATTTRLRSEAFC
jgi:hypothetical protein